MKTGTTIKTENGGTMVRLSRTDIVRFNEKIIELDSGGWKTATTKRRMNEAAVDLGLGFEVYQEKGEWWIKFKGEVRLFYDGIVIERKRKIKNKE